jgi:hypothetical protein
MNISMPIPMPPKASDVLVPFAAEGGHWYDKRGEPMYMVMGRDGVMRPTTLRDARKLNLFPSVTTIMRCADAPALNRWKQQQLLLSTLTLPRVEGEDLQAFASRVIDDADEQAKQARDTGTIIHDAIEKVLCDEECEPGYEKHVSGAIKALNDWCGLDGILAEKSFAHPLGFGGKCDAHKLPSDYLAEEGWVSDYKSKDFDESKLPKLYENHSMQLAAYREGFGMPRARCAIIFVSTKVPGLTHLVEVEPTELDRGWEMFSTLVRFWQIKNQYVPSSAEGSA